MNWTRITFFAFCPSLLAMGGGILADLLFGRFGAERYGLYAFVGGTVLSVIFAAAAIYHLRKWEFGDGNCCQRCSGPLSWIQNAGVKWYGKELPNFHRCWNCGKPNGIH